MNKKPVLKLSNHCFACGPENSIGLRLKIESDGDGVKTTFYPEKHFEGYSNIVHGGIIATLLDELIVWAVRARGINAVTGELNVRFKNPLPVGEKSEISGKVIKSRGNLVIGESIIKDSKGKVIAQATAKMVRP